MSGLIGDDDRRLHRDSADPFWNESAFFSFSVRERRLSGFVYCFFRPNMGFAVGGPALWDPSGEHSWDCLYYDWDWPQEIPAGAEALNFSFENGTSVKTIEPMREYRIGYEGSGCRLDLHWTAVTAHHDIVIGAGIEETGRRHYEQFGRMTGTVEIGDLHLAVDSWSMRDRSWGPRRMRVSPRGDYCWAVAGPDHAFHVTAVGRPGEAEDRVAAGLYLRDGVMADLVAGRRYVVERFGPRPAVVRIEAEDALGRQLVAEGRVRNALEWQGYGHQFQWWCLAEWTFDGVTTYGEEQEFHPLRSVREHFRAHPAP